MKLKVIQAFHDKDTDELYQIGQTLDVTETRGKELLSNPLSLVEVVGNNKTQQKKSTKTRK